MNSVKRGAGRMFWRSILSGRLIITPAEADVIKVFSGRG
jgi:hypothetical protein